MRGDSRYTTPEETAFSAYIFFIIIFPLMLRCELFGKAGKRKFLSFIPFYGTYLFYGLYSDIRLFWIYIILWPLQAFLLFAGNGILTDCFRYACSLLLYVFWILPFFGCAMRFGKKKWFYVFLILLFPVFALNLAYGKDKYILPTEKKTKKRKRKKTHPIPRKATYKKAAGQQ